MFSTKGIISELTKEQIIDEIGEYNLWRKYINSEVLVGKKFLSPLQEEDDPSAVLFIGRSGQILLQDFRLGTYNIFSYLKKTRNWSFSDCLRHISEDFGLSSAYNPKVSQIKPNESTVPLKVLNEHTSVIVKNSAWQQYEYEYFSQYHITQSTLDVLHVNPIEFYWLLKGDNSYQFFKKKNELLFSIEVPVKKYKIYRPEQSTNKWYSFCSSNDLIGLDSLPESGEVLVLTKGLKEVAILRELKINSVALQSENSYPSSHLIRELEKRFTHLYSLMDLDQAGKESANKLYQNYLIKPIKFSKKYLEQGIKDMADITKLEGLEVVNKLIQEQL